mmetsp:Transcript_22967/g.48826  ORF Transcript_22967/g.48826 Transcript_22967/m.48826 type:complete len:252 (+) Transcript_22967:1436-2191(+)
MVVPSAEVAKVVLVQGAEHLVILVVVSQAELASSYWPDELLRDPDESGQPIEDSEELRPCVRAADGLQLGPVHLDGILQSAHDRRHLVLHLTVDLELGINLRDQETEDIEEFLGRRVFQELFVGDALPVIARCEDIHNVPCTLSRKAAVANRPWVARVPHNRASTAGRPHGVAKACAITPVRGCRGCAPLTRRGRGQALEGVDRGASWRLGAQARDAGRLPERGPEAIRLGGAEHVRSQWAPVRPGCKDIC